MIVMCSRVIVGILDAFHFDLRNSQHAVVNLPDAIAKKKAKGEITGMGFIFMRKREKNWSSASSYSMNILFQSLLYIKIC